MSGRWNRLPRFARLLAFAVTAILAFAMAAGIGAVAALVVSGNLGSSTGGVTRSAASSAPGEQVESTQYEQAGADVAQRQYSGAKREQGTPQDEQTNYVNEVGEIQTRSVDAFLDSHKKLLRYDALSSGDVEEMRADQAALERYADRAGALGAPQKYEEHKKVFLSAIEEMHQAARLAYSMAADPVSATQSDFEQYDRLVGKAAADLRQSNEFLGKDYKTIEGVEKVGASR